MVKEKKEKNIIMKEDQYMKEDIKMVKDMDLEKYILIDGKKIY